MFCLLGNSLTVSDNLEKDLTYSIYVVMVNVVKSLIYINNMTLKPCRNIPMYGVSYL